VADVDRIDLGGAPLEEAIGEAAGGCADVERGGAGGVDGEVIEGAFEFQATATDVLRWCQDESSAPVSTINDDFVSTWSPSFTWPAMMARWACSRLAK
jgi:hypothetical protein